MKRQHVVALSGGKDSTAMALELKRLHPEIDYEYVCTPTGDELPEMEQHYWNLEALLGKPLTKLPCKTLNQLIDEWNMIPNFRMRWCTRVIKIEPFIEYMEGLEEGSVMYVGLRADESGRLGLVQPDAKFKVDCPMQEWGWDEESVKSYLACCGVVIPRRTDCARCFWNTLGEWHLLWLEHREIFEEAIAQEERVGHTFRSEQRDSWPASLKLLGQEFERQRIPKTRKKRAKNPDKCRFCTM